MSESKTHRSRPIVAIDGPAGAGKSNVARRLADALGFTFVDTGALYRAVALLAIRGGVGWDNGAALGVVAKDVASSLTFGRDDAGVRVFVRQEDVTDAIRSPQIASGASSVSSHPDVRAALLEFQRETGRNGGVVLEGRDIGTVVFPDAEVKIFLTARPDIRARRRFNELVARGERVTFDDVLDDVQRRDTRDTGRPVAPLRQAAEAIVVDSSDISIDDTVAQMVAIVRAQAAG